MRADSEPCGQADVDDFDAAGVLGAGERVQPDLGMAERDREVGGNGARVDGAGVGVDAGREVDGDDARRLRPAAESTHALQDLGQVRLDGTRRSGAEEGVDDELGVGEEAVEGGEAGVVLSVGDVDFALDELGEVGDRRRGVWPAGRRAFRRPSPGGVEPRRGRRRRCCRDRPGRRCDAP